MNDLVKTEQYIIDAFAGTSRRFEWWGLRKNGEIFPKDVTLNRGVYAGRQVVFAMSRDITERFEALKALKESEDKYRTLTNHLPVGVYRTTIDGRFIYANPSLVRILGYDSSDDLLNTDVRTLFADPSDRVKQLEEAEHTLEFIRNSIRLRKKDGDIIWVRDSSRLVYNNDGSPAFFDGILEDITESIRKENAVKESEANLKAILENTLESIWSVDRNYRILYVNEVFVNAFYSAFGKKLERGVNVVESIPENLREMWYERYSRTFNNEHFLFEDKVETEAGAVAYIEVSMNPIVIDGDVVGASLYGRDVTEKRLREIQLQYLSDLRNLLVELSTGFINLPFRELDSAINHSLARLGEFVGADRSYVIEYDFKNNTGTNTFEWCREGIEPQIGQMQNIPLGSFSEWIGIHRNGEIVKVDDASELPQNNLRALLEVQSIISMITIPLIYGGVCQGFVGFDSVRSKHLYTEYEKQLLQVYAQMIVNAKERIVKENSLVRAKEKAEESDRLKTAFLANMSHEIRTPMNGIIGFLELLRETNLSEENKAAYIEIVTQSGHRLLDTINDIIEISKIESGELKTHFSEINVSELLGYYHGFFRQQADQKGLKYIVTNDLPVSVTSFISDRSKLESILSNLIKNAIKFTKKGQVEFGCFLGSDNLNFFVKDTGTGIPADKLESIFDRFVQGDQSNSRTHEGSGLGLSIVKAYVQMLGGKVWVESEPAKGSTFSFYIPYRPVLTEKKQENTVNREVKSTELNVTILIAEDDFASYLYLERLLAGAGVKFIHTTNGTDTVRVVKENSEISLVLMDLRMPGMSGLEAVRMIRQFNKSIPVIAQTAYALAGDRDVALKAGCDDYITKPVKKTELIEKVQKFTTTNRTKSV